MKWYVIAALVVAASFATMDARAEFLSGNDLHRHCVSTDYGDRGFCQGFIAGVYDTSVHVNFCAPEGSAGVNVGQVVDIVKKHLNSSLNSVTNWPTS
jgi:Rap1a immunity proteins